MEFAEFEAELKRFQPRRLYAKSYSERLFAIYGPLPVEEWRQVMDELVRFRKPGRSVSKKAFVLAFAIVRGNAQQAKRVAIEPVREGPAYGTEEYWQKYMAQITSPKQAAWILEHSFMKLPDRVRELLREKIGEGIRDA